MPGQALSIAASKLASLGLAAKLGVAATVTTAGVAGAGAAGVLPDQVNERARDAIEVVTPLELDEPATDHGDNFGSTVSSDATGESDGEPGVDGREISEMAPGAAHRPDDPGRAPAEAGPPEDTGVDRATDSPGAPALPEDAGAPEEAPDAAETAPSTVPAAGGAAASARPDTPAG